MELLTNCICPDLQFFQDTMTPLDHEVEIVLVQVSILKT